MRWIGSAPARSTAAVRVETSGTDLDPAVVVVYTRGVEHYLRSEYASATREFERALALRHDLAEAHFYLGLIARVQAQPEDAADSLLLATTFKPDFAEAWHFLGVVDLECNRYDAARQNFETALRIKPDYADVHYSYAKLCEEQKQLGEAISHATAALRLNPDYARGYCELARLTLLDSADAAIARRHADKALELQPHLAEAHSCSARVLQFEGRCEEALSECEIALQIDPTAFRTRMIRAFALLMRGDFAAGWRDYEERKKIYPIYSVRRFPYPDWDGTPPAGRRILVYYEQGLGDEIMFASCIPELLALGADCIIECSSKLESLFRRSFLAATIIVADQTSPDMSYLSALAPCDWQVAAGSLPGYFRRRRDEFPAAARYLIADAARVECWRGRLRQLGTGLKVGLSWRGGAKHSNQSNRSIELEQLLPALKLSDCQFVSLQYGECRAEIEQMLGRHGVRVQHWPEAIESYDETAALVSAVDMVITIDTSVAHLSGALGTKTWVMLPANPEWRYLNSGERTPWYPAMRLFRHARGADWEAVIDRVAADLAGVIRAA